MVVMGIWEGDGAMIMLIHMPSPSEKGNHCSQYRSEKKERVCMGMITTHSLCGRMAMKTKGVVEAMVIYSLKGR